MGLREGDLVLEVNGKKVNDPSDIDGATRRSGKALVLLIERGGRTFFASLKMD